MFKIDTGEQFQNILPQASAVDATMDICIRTLAQSNRLVRKITEAVEAHECAERLAEYWASEDLTLDALHLFDANITPHLNDIYEGHRAALIHGGAHQSAQAVPHRTVSGIPNAQSGNTDKDQNNGF